MQGLPIYVIYNALCRSRNVSLKGTEIQTPRHYLDIYGNHVPELGMLETSDPAREGACAMSQTAPVCFCI
jgi:hypothetical protein